MVYRDIPTTNTCIILFEKQKFFLKNI